LTKRAATWKKAFMTMCAIAGTAVVGVPAAAYGGALPTSLPNDQLIVSGSCVTESQLLTASLQAISDYAPGSQPAGVYINGNWVPANLLFVEVSNYVSC
jgi:hypothetical protein